MEKRITLTRDASGWMATFHGDAVSMEIFGTETIPTCFTANAPAWKVLAAIQNLNPKFKVYIEERT